MRIFAENSRSVAYKAIIAGASGLVGGLLLDILLDRPEYGDVLVLVRKELPVKHKKLTQLIIDFDKLQNYSSEIAGHAVFSCLGTTRKKTPDQSVYRKIDQYYPVTLAKIAAGNGVEQFHLVSAIGANASSSNSYTRMKGETEDDVMKNAPPCLHIYQPSMITGDRQESRPAERILTAIFKVVDPVLIGGLKKYKSVPAASIAMAMFKESLIKNEGVFIHPSDKIKEIL